MAVKQVDSKCSVWQLLWISGLLTSLWGCRTTWQSERGTDPSFDRLIEIEQQASNQQHRRPLARKLRPGSTPKPSGRYAQQDSQASESNNPLHSDPEFQEAYAEASPVEQALLDRFGKALSPDFDLKHDNPVANTRRSGTDGVELASATQPAPRNAARRSISDNEPSTSASTPPASRGSRPDLASRTVKQRHAPEESSPISFRMTDDQDATSAGATDERQFAHDDRSSRAPAAEPAAMPQAGQGQPGDDVQFASHTTAHSPQVEINSPRSDSELANMTYRDLAHALVQKLEDEQLAVSNPDEQIDLAKKRRLINLVLDDLDAAEEPIEGLQPEAQAYIRHTIHGLYDATDINGNPVASRRLTLALQSHRRASRELQRLANLEVVNLAFCTEVDSFGLVTKFPQFDFRPDQEVLLYCELENFVSESVRGGYETQLQGSYEILDADGRRVADQLLPQDSDVCGNIRQDFYIAYRLHMPEKIQPGRYQLKLTIEDMKGHKFGQSSIDFQIVR